MKDLLINEYYKFRKNNVVLSVLGLYTLLAPLLILYGEDLMKDFPPPFPSPKLFYEFPTVWDYQAYLAGNWIAWFLLGFLVIYIITSEVANKTMRQGILNGLTRKEYFTAKIALIVCIAIYSTLIYTLSCIIIGILNTPDWDLELALDNNMAIMRFFLINLGYMSLAALIAFLIRRGILAILVYYAYTMVMELVIRGFHLYLYKHKSVLYYPQNIIEDLAPNPLMKMSNNFIGKEFDFAVTLSYAEAMGLSFLLIILFVYGAYTLMIRRDL